MEGDFAGWLRPVDSEIFQSTPSAWRETQEQNSLMFSLWNFNPLPPHGGRPSGAVPADDLRQHFNPLPPHGGRRKSRNGKSSNHTYFNPLPPHGGRLIRPFPGLDVFHISIHSLRMEGDIFSPFPFRKTEEFQSTPSAWRETPILLYTSWVARYFNPLPPHGGRPSHRSSPATPSLFQSTPSAWRETCSRP